MEESWVKWEPINELSNSYSIELLAYTPEDFKITLINASNKQKKVIVIFENSVRVYRVTERGLWEKSSMNNLYKDFHQSWAFYKVANSTYSAWLREESHAIYLSEWFMHFSFVGSNAVIDVLAGYDPQVKFVEITKSK